MGRSAPKGATLRSLRRFLPDAGQLAVPVERASVPTEPTDLERSFAAAWWALGGPEVAWDLETAKPGALVWQVRFAPPRLFRWDFAVTEAKVGIDLQGGSHDGRGWHQQRDRYREDCEKLNLASALGWRVFHLTGAMVNDEPAKHIGPIIRLVREGAT